MFIHNRSTRLAVLRQVESSIKCYRSNEFKHVARHFTSNHPEVALSGDNMRDNKDSFVRHNCYRVSTPTPKSPLGRYFPNCRQFSRNIYPGGLLLESRRSFSTSISDSITSCAASSPEAEMAKFELTAASAEAAETAAEATAPWAPTWWPQDQILELIINIHDASGLNYAFTIGALTLVFRTAMLPLFVKAQQNSSRLAHMKPEMDIIQEKMKLLDPKDLEGQQHLAKQVQALFKKYDCNPLKSLVIIPIQMPVFMGTFFALKQFPDIFPEKLVDSGILWFTDLSVPDPYGILPMSSALSFLIMMELGKKQMMATNPAQGKAMLNFFRGIAVIMIPATWNFPSVIFCYWTANNAFSMVQSAAFNNASIRKMLGIWDPPKPVPGAPPPKGMKELFDDMMQKRKEDSEKTNMQDRIKMHNAAIDKKNADKMKEEDGVGRKRRKNRGRM
mmetsp:Transcript_12685/g.23772  ORF Transcript_12685/g.23772 Transcript_12685/m.23772 type:complete len:446 (-) Transcript_12685:1657-2994(-)